VAVVDPSALEVADRGALDGGVGLGAGAEGPQVVVGGEDTGQEVALPVTMLSTPTRTFEVSSTW
jgi:hypothetical protein